MQDHCSEIARQLLVSEGFDQDGEWLPIVQRLAAEAVSGVDPRATGPIGNFDICFYIKASP